MRAIGPAGATALFAISVDKQLLGGRLVYYVLLVISAAGVGFSFLVDDGPMAMNGNT